MAFQQFHDPRRRGTAIARFYGTSTRPEIRYRSLSKWLSPFRTPTHSERNDDNRFEGICCGIPNFPSLFTEMAIAIPHHPYALGAER
ncbi:MAG: hypothetical protein ACQKBT_01995 [Puniceicoccales bacterium]